MKDHRIIIPANGIGPAAGKSPRDYLRERAARRHRPGRPEDRRSLLARMKRDVYALEYELRADGEAGHAG